MFGSYSYLTLDTKEVVKAIKSNIYDVVRKKIKEE